MLWSSAETGFSTNGLLNTTPFTSTWSSDSTNSWSTTRNILVMSSHIPNSVTQKEREHQHYIKNTFPAVYLSKDRLLMPAAKKVLPLYCFRIAIILTNQYESILFMLEGYEQIKIQKDLIWFTFVNLDCFYFTLELQLKSKGKKHNLFRWSKQHFKKKNLSVLFAELISFRMFTFSVPCEQFLIYFNFIHPF